MPWLHSHPLTGSVSARYPTEKYSNKCVRPYHGCRDIQTHAPHTRQNIVCTCTEGRQWERENGTRATDIGVIMMAKKHHESSLLRIDTASMETESRQMYPIGCVCALSHIKVFMWIVKDVCAHGTTLGWASRTNSQLITWRRAAATTASHGKWFNHRRAQAHRIHRILSNGRCFIEYPHVRLYHRYMHVHSTLFNFFTTLLFHTYYAIKISIFVRIRVLLDRECGCYNTKSQHHA